MASAQEEAEFTTKLAREHGISEDAVRTVFDALRRSGGTMAQFSHADFGGMSQWSSGMTMVGDMFNNSLKAKLNAIAAGLSRYLRDHHPVEDRGDDRAVSYRSATRPAGSWWSQELGDPSPVGSQNDMRYAVFPLKRRLVTTITARPRRTTPAITRFLVCLKRRARIRPSLSSASTASSAFRILLGRTGTEPGLSSDWALH